MSTYAITVNDEEVTKQIEAIINRIFTNELHNSTTESCGGINQFIKEYVYSHKDEIIEKVVERASREIVKKAMPKLMDRLVES